MPAVSLALRMRRSLVAMFVGVGTICLATAGHWAWSASGRPVAATVTTVVRNDLGQLTWMRTEATGYTPLEAEGRRLYLWAGCTYCHSQYVRPVVSTVRPWGPISASSERWGPISEPGEYAFDAPPSFGTRGIAPDLSREGLKYSDEWHLAHFWNPPMLRRGSIMGGFSGLFDTPRERVRIVKLAGIGATLEQTQVTRQLFDFASKQPVKLTPNADGLLFVPAVALHKFPLIWTPNQEYSGPAVRLVAESHAIEALVAYVQKLGMNRGRWRDLYEPADIEGTKVALPRSPQWIAAGKQVYQTRCMPCHGEKGDGNGWAATFLYRQRPRNFTLGEFKFRLTKGPLPTDADLLRTISRGVRGTAMPAWFELPLDDRLAVIQYIKYELTVDRSDPQNPDYFFNDEPPGEPLQIGTPPAASPALLQRGHAVWLQAKCWECHGKQGHGDGEKAAGLKDDWDFPIRPANLARGQFKSGPYVSDIFRTISTGLTGTPMPSFRDAFPTTDRWALSYYILSLSAFTDSLTGEMLPITPAERAALNESPHATSGPEQAYGPALP